MADNILESGYPTILTFTTVPSIPLYEKSIKPFGLDAGGSTDVTTMRTPVNPGLREMAAKKLATLTNATVTWAYKESVWAPANLIAMLRINQLVTMTFPNGMQYAVWAFLDKAEPGELSVEEAQPTIEGTLAPTNRNSSGVSTAPAYTAPP